MRKIFTSSLITAISIQTTIPASSVWAQGPAPSVSGASVSSAFPPSASPSTATGTSAGTGTTAGEPVAFKTWKDQQIIEAQNQLARVNNRLVLLKAGKVKPEEISAEFNNFNALAKNEKTGTSTPLPTSRAQKLSSKDVVSRLELELARTQKSLDFAKELGLQEYFLGYLIQFQESPEALAAVAGRLSKEEVAELLKVLLKSNQTATTQGGGPGEARRMRSAFDKLEASAL
jgi:hypothetical protein